MAPGRARGYLRDMETNADLRRELEAAIANVRRQIGDNESSSGMAPRGSAPVDLATATAGLRDTLAELEDALAGLEADDA